MSNREQAGLTAWRSWGLFGKKQKPCLVWRCQFASYLPPPEDIDALLHRATGTNGVFEIYDDGRNFLLSFPRAMSLPAELFTSLSAAKGRAALANGDEGK